MFTFYNNSIFCIFSKQLNLKQMETKIKELLKATNFHTSFCIEMQRGKSASVIEFPSIRFFSNVVEI
jgi:hypothetical protein